MYSRILSFLHSGHHRKGRRSGFNSRMIADSENEEQVSSGRKMCDHEPDVACNGGEPPTLQIFPTLDLVKGRMKRQLRPGGETLWVLCDVCCKFSCTYEQLRFACPH